VRKAKTAAAWITYDDGREVCQENTAGRREYRRRTLAMRDRQGELCARCGEWMSEADTTFDHENGRGGGKRDDRIEVDGERQNAALHGKCNHEKGSKREPYLFGVSKQ